MLTIPYNIMTLCVFLSTVSFAAVPLPELCNNDGAACAGYTAVFTEPPKNCPSDTAVDAPLLGNGYMGVCIGGGPENPTFWLAMNDFWRLKSQYGESQPRVFGNIALEFPELEGAIYRVEQKLDRAISTCTFSKDNVTLNMSVWVAATENVLVVEMWTDGMPLQAKMRLNVGEGGEIGTNWMIRGFTENVDIPVKAACVVNQVGMEGSEFEITDRPVKLVIALASSFKCDDPLEKARSLCAQSPDKLWEAHCCWWSEYWAASSVAIDDPDIMRHYYLSNYVMACCSRNPDFPPSIFGTWITTDTPAWQGDYHLNYNHMAPYYGLYSSNHIETAAPYEAPILAFMDRGKWYAQEVHQCRGVLYPVGIGPLGIETTRNSPYKDPHQKRDGLFYGQKSNAAYAVVNMAMRWRLTYDLDYARLVYPFVREVVDFWEDALTFEEGRYVIHGDSVHEGSGKDFNSVVSLGLVRNAVETALDMSTELALDAERREKWQQYFWTISVIMLPRNVTARQYFDIQKKELIGGRTTRWASSTSIQQELSVLTAIQHFSKLREILSR